MQKSLRNCLTCRQDDKKSALKAKKLVQVFHMPSSSSILWRLVTAFEAKFFDSIAQGFYV